MSDTNPSKVVLVTGATRGLGRGIARAFGRNGATVYITGRPGSEAALADAVKEIEDCGGKGVAVAVDGRDRDGMALLMQRIGNDAGHLDILVNNAAIAIRNSPPLCPSGKNRLKWAT